MSRVFVGRLFFAAAAGCIALPGCGGKAVVDGAPGSGGASGTATGSQTASSTGFTANSSSATGGAACDQIAAAYRKAIIQDSTCCLQCNNVQCKNQVRVDLQMCCQLTWVNSTAQLMQLQAQYRMQGCDKCGAVDCPAMPPTIGECVPAGMGTCQTVPVAGGQ